MDVDRARKAKRHSCGVLSVLQEVADSITTEIKPCEAEWNEYLYGLTLPDGVDLAKGKDVKGRLFVARRIPMAFGSSTTEVVLQRYTPDHVNYDTTLVVSNIRYPAVVGAEYVRALITGLAPKAPQDAATDSKDAEAEPEGAKLPYRFAAGASKRPVTDEELEKQSHRRQFNFVFPPS
jgi:hypothetical protein